MDKIMDNNNNQDWRDVACAEQKQRLALELQLNNTEDTLSKVRKELQSAHNYIEYMEHKTQDLEHKYAVQNRKFQGQTFKLKKILDLLKKAKVVINQRKQEYMLLKAENLSLNALLEQKSLELEEELFIHNQTKHQLDAACNKIMELTVTHPSAELTEYAPTQPEQLEDYFVHKALTTTTAEEQITDDLLQTDTDFMQQLLYLEQQYSPDKP